MVSIIIPTYNAAANIERLLNCVVASRIEKEIIVVDSDSTDNTCTVAESLAANVIKIRKKDFDHGGTRNLAARYAHGDIIVFLTQDVRPVDGFALERLIKPFTNDERIGAVYGRQVPHSDASFFASHLRAFNYPETSYVVDLTDSQTYGFKTLFLSNSFAAYRKSALEEVGWFKDKLISNEDTYASAKLLMAGYRLVYASDAMVYHSHNYTIAQEFTRYFDIGVFHQGEKWIIDKFGKAEGEGKRYIKSQLVCLMNTKKYYLLPEFFLRNGMKFAGFTLGKHYTCLPRRLVKKFSMHKDWWEVA